MNFDSEFFRSCRAIAERAIAEQESTGLPISQAPTTTAVGNSDLKDASGSPLISDSYPGTAFDFYGFPPNPIFYRTGDPWPVPKGPQAQRMPREVRQIFGHPIGDVWRTLGQQLYEFLDSLEVKWSTIDPVRFAEQGGEIGPLYLWVGVDPGSLSIELAKAAAVGCKKILADAQFPDVEIAFRESVVTRGPQLLHHVRVPSVAP